MALTDPTLTTSPGAGATPTLTDPNSGSNLSSALDTRFAPTQNTIMQNYEQAKGLTYGATQNLNQSISDRYQQDINFQNQMNSNQGTGMLEGQRGFAINPGAIVAFQQQADKRVKDLRNQMNDALLNNNASGAKALSDLIVNEQSAITQARTSFLNQYFGTQSEARAEAGFQTPEQQSVMALANAHPDANITPGDSMQAATDKVRNSVSYQQNIRQGEASIKAANAQAGLAGAQTGLTNVESAIANRGLGFINGNNGGNYDQADVQALLANQKNPGTGMTPDQLKNKLAGSMPTFSAGGTSFDPASSRYASTIAAAQALGYNPQQAAIGAGGAYQNSLNVAGGGLSALETGTTNVLGNIFGSVGRFLSGGGSQSSGPSYNGIQLPN